MTTTVTIYRPTHEAACLNIAIDTGSDHELQENQQAYDDSETAYFDYVRAELAAEGFELEISATDHGGRTYTVSADSVEDEERAHYLMCQGRIQDFWSWYN